jgi:hypothetical protein
MKTYYKLRISTLFCLVLLVMFNLASCTKEIEAPSSISPAIKSSSDIYVKSGRLYFKNFEVFAATREKLAKANNLEAIKRWEESLGFSSLRAKAASSTNNSASALVQSFHFPMFYTAMMNEDGEYQIGDDIVWFHEGYKYRANSESNLLAIKANPSLTQDKTLAGATLNAIVKKKDLNSHVATRTQDSGDSPDARYQYNYTSPYAIGMVRFVYETYVYTERNCNGNVNPYGQPICGNGFYTVLYLNIKMEIGSGNNWYPSGLGRYVSYSLDLYANVQHTPGCCASEPRTEINGHVEVPGYFHTTNDVQVVLGSGLCTISNSSFTGYTRAGVKWNYDIYGQITSFDEKDTSRFFYVADYTNSLWQ